MISIYMKFPLFIRCIKIAKWQNKQINTVLRKILISLRIIIWGQISELMATRVDENESKTFIKSNDGATLKLTNDAMKPIIFT